MIAVLSGPDAVVLAAVFAGLPATIAAIASIRAARQATGANQQATAANQAVNDVGPDQPKLRELVADTNTAVIGLQADVREIQADRAREALIRERRQDDHDIEHRQTRGAIEAVAEQLRRYAPVIDEWRRSHPEIRLDEDLDDDGGQT